MIVSLYSLDWDGQWHATHRLPLASAVSLALDIRARSRFGDPVAIVADCADPAPVLAFVSSLSDPTAL